MRLSLLVLAAGSLLAGNAFAAQSAPMSFNVTASVSNSCRVTSTSDINFNAYDPVSDAVTNATGSVSVRCTKGTVADVRLDEGQHAVSGAGGSTCAAPLRQMTAGAENLRYGIYQDSNRTIPWGCDATNDVAYTSASSSAPVTLTTYGQIPASQNVASGNYSDSVNVYIVF